MIHISAFDLAQKMIVCTETRELIGDPNWEHLRGSIHDFVHVIPVNIFIEILMNGLTAGIVLLYNTFFPLSNDCRTRRPRYIVSTHIDDKVLPRKTLFIDIPCLQCQRESKFSKLVFSDIHLLVWHQFLPRYMIVEVPHGMLHSNFEGQIFDTDLEETRKIYL